MTNYDTLKDKFMDYFYNFVNGFFMMRTVPQMWYALKMCLFSFVTISITFAISYQIQNELHRFWFPLFDYKVIIDFTSWTVIYLGAFATAIIIGYYSFMIGTYMIQRWKNKKNKL
jgi:hypothetical protein